MVPAPSEARSSSNVLTLSSSFPRLRLKKKSRMSFINSIARRLSGAGMEESDGFVVVPPTPPQTDSAPSAPTISLSLKQKHR